MLLGGSLSLALDRKDGDRCVHDGRRWGHLSVAALAPLWLCSPSACGRHTESLALSSPHSRASVLKAELSEDLSYPPEPTGSEQALLGGGAPQWPGPQTTPAPQP